MRGSHSEVDEEKVRGCSSSALGAAGVVQRPEHAAARRRAEVAGVDPANNLPASVGVVWAWKVVRRRPALFPLIGLVLMMLLAEAESVAMRCYEGVSYSR